MGVQSSKGLIASELKYPWRWDLFLKKVDEGLPFPTMDGSEVRIPREGNELLVQALKARSRDEYNRAFRTGVNASRGDDPVVLRSASVLHKSADFGGKSAGHGLRAQRRQIDAIRSALRAVGCGGAVPIFLGDRVVPVVDIQEVQGRGVKADAVLLDDGGSVVARVSLKCADRPREMQQWSGLSQFSDDPEVRRFVSYVTGLPRDVLPLCRTLSSARVRREALYGVGPERVDVVVAASDVGLRRRVDGTYDFSGRVHYYPDVPPDGSGWEPVLFARSSASRRDLGVEGVRFGAFPRGARRRVRMVP
jgi:hypothetical protein